MIAIACLTQTCHDPQLPVPPVGSLPELADRALFLLRFGIMPFHLRFPRCSPALQVRIACCPDRIARIVALALAHQPQAAESRVAAQETGNAEPSVPLWRAA